jgi:predicted O-methyltransferase YrrM
MTFVDPSMQPRKDVMISSPMEMRALTMDLTTSMWTLGAITVLFESGLATHLREPASVDELAGKCPALSHSRIERCLAVATTAGVVSADGGRFKLAEGAQAFSAPPMLAMIKGDLRAHLMQVMAYVDAATGEQGTSGWRHTNRALLQAQGDASAAFVPAFKMSIVGTLDGLAARLDRPGARMLDVGTGVGSLAIAMCRAFPSLAVVGLDPYEVPLAIARENVQRAGLAERIELRATAVEELSDEDAYDLAWLPSFFIPESTLSRALARVRTSLRSGGWLLFPIGTSAGDERQRNTIALVSELWGGPALSVPQAEALLKGAGFATVRPLAGPSWAIATLAAQR